MLFLSEDDIDAVVTMEDAVAAVRHAFVSQALNHAYNLPRTRVQLSNALFQIMGGLVPAGAPTSAEVPSSGWTLAKVGASTKSTRRTWSLLFDPDANLRCILLSQRLGQLRTGAATGVSVDALARKDAKVVACVGAGFHGRTALEAISLLRPDLRVVVWGRTPEKTARFRDQVQGYWKERVETREEVDVAAAESDIIVTITPAAEPVLHGVAVTAGTHVVLAGSNFPHKREADAELFRRASAVYVDELAQAKTESGDLILAAAEGALDWGQVRPMAQAVAMADGLAPAAPPRQPSDITVFSSQGVGIWDTALAVVAYRNAVERGVGTEIPIDGAAVSKDR